MTIENLSAPQLHSWLNERKDAAPVLIDVREGWELERAAMSGVVHIPLRELAGRAHELDPEMPTVMICHHGTRSMQACRFLQKLGFDQIFNLEGGINAWSRTVDGSIPIY